MPGGKRPSHLRERALAALLETGSITAAASRAGVAERTLRNWLKQPEFTEAYQQARRRLVDEAVLGLQHGARRAVATLVTHLSTEEPGPAIRAAQIILDQCFRGTEVLDLIEAVDSLKHQLEGFSHGRGQSATEGGEDAGGSSQGDPGEERPAEAGAAGPSPLDD